MCYSLCCFSKSCVLVEVLTGVSVLQPFESSLRLCALIKLVIHRLYYRIIGMANFDAFSDYNPAYGPAFAEMFCRAARIR